MIVFYAAVNHKYHYNKSSLEERDTNQMNQNPPIITQGRDLLNPLEQTILFLETYPKIIDGGVKRNNRKLFYQVDSWHVKEQCVASLFTFVHASKHLLTC